MTDMELGDTRLIIDECGRQSLSLRQAAYVLATAYWETAHTMKPVQEAYWMSEAWRRQKLRYYPWHGRGYVQLTWEKNYKRASEKIGVDLVADPRAAMDPKIAAKILVIGCRDGWFTGKSLSNYIREGRTDYVNARRVVNGTDKARVIAEIAIEYQQALTAERYGEKPKPSGIWAVIAEAFRKFLDSLKGGKNAKRK